MCTVTWQLSLISGPSAPVRWGCACKQKGQAVDVAGPANACQEKARQRDVATNVFLPARTKLLNMFASYCLHNYHHKSGPEHGRGLLHGVLSEVVWGRPGIDTSGPPACLPSRNLSLLPAPASAACPRSFKALQIPKSLGVTVQCIVVT